MDKINVCYTGDGANWLLSAKWLEPAAEMGVNPYLISHTEIPLRVQKLCPHAVPEPIKPIHHMKLGIKNPKVRRQVNQVCGWEYLPLRSWKHFGYFLHCLQLKGFFENALSSWPIDIIHSHFINHPFSVNAAFSEKYRHLPKILTVWGSDLYIHPGQSGRRKKITGQILNSVDLVHVESQRQKNGVMEYGVKSEKILIQPLGVAIPEARPKVKPDEILKKLGIQPDDKVILSLRKLGPIYDPLTIINSIPLVLKEIPKCKFVIGSFGPLRKKCEKRVKSLGIENNTIFTGIIPQEELPDVFKITDTYIQTPLSDGISDTQITAMAYGIPTISTDVGDTSENVIPDQTGYLIPTKKPKALADKIVWDIKNSYHHEIMGRNSRERAIKFHDEKQIRIRWKKLYEDLAKK